MTATIEWRGQERCEDLLGETLSDDARAHAQHVRVVVGASHPSRVQVVAQSCANATNLVGCELFTLTAPPEDDAQVGAPIANLSPYGGAELHVVDALGRVGAEVEDLVAIAAQARREVLFQMKAGMVGTDGDSRHGTRV